MINQKRHQINGIILVALGAASYGVLAALVKLAYQENYTPAEVCIAQALTGLLALAVLNLFAKVMRPKAAMHVPEPVAQNRHGIVKLMLAGTSMGLTTLFYYWAVRYVAVSVAIVLLMQSVWMGVGLEAILHRQWPSRSKLVAVIVILVGTVLATNVLAQQEPLNQLGVLYGLAAAAAYTSVLFTANRIALHLPPMQRAFWILCGGSVMVLLISAPSLMNSFNPSIFLKWGLLLGFFGTLLPPLLFSMGMPRTGVGLGTIVAAVELPVSVLAARLLINESVSAGQWCGIVLILMAIVLMHVPGRLRQS